MEFTKEQAKIIVYADCEYGVETAVDTLKKMGFNTSSYYRVTRRHPDDDDVNLDAKNNLYKKLGITKQIEEVSDYIQNYEYSREEEETFENFIES